MKLEMPTLTEEQIRSFHKKYNKSSSGCWEWNACKNTHNYGTVAFNGKAYKASRIMWFLINGSLSQDLCVLHVCDNPSCVNPDHLFLGTQKDNAIDRTNKNRGYSAPASSNGHSRFTWETIKEIRTLYCNGEKSQEQLSVMFDTTVSHIRRVVTNISWVDHNYVPCGRPNRERLATKRVTERQVLDIRKMNKAGRSRKEIIKIMKVSPTTVNKILSGVTWKHIQLEE